MEAMWTRFFPAIQEVIELVKAGKIGKLLRIESSFGYESVFDPNSRVFCIYDCDMSMNEIADYVSEFGYTFSRAVHFNSRGSGWTLSLRSQFVTLKNHALLH